MGERVTPTERDQLVHRHRMRVRTVTVSFGAAVHSARHDLAVGGAERDALIETWRAWSLSVLDGYGEEMEQLRRSTSDAETRQALEELLEELRRVRDEVRTA